MNIDVLAICNAYESGYGHGYDMRDLQNPYCSDTNEWEAWDYGYGEGGRKRARHDPKFYIINDVDRPDERPAGAGNRRRKLAKQ